MGVSECKLVPKLVPKDEAKADSISPHSFARAGLTQKSSPGAVRIIYIYPSHGGSFQRLLWQFDP